MTRREQRPRHPGLHPDIAAHGQQVIGVDLVGKSAARGNVASGARFIPIQALLGSAGLPAEPVHAPLQPAAREAVDGLRTAYEELLAAT